MKAFNRIFIISILLIVVIFAVANTVLIVDGEDGGRPYLVEVSRICIDIENGTFDKTKLADYNYVTNVVKMGDAYYDRIAQKEEIIDEEKFYNTTSDYTVREINGELYRFDYFVEAKDIDVKAIAIVNTVFVLVLILVVIGLVYVRRKILSPFDRLKDVPYELSKGNLVTPIKETKSKFFGRFVWGVDMLRENMEQQKERELNLQKDRKTLLLALSHDLKTPLSEIKLYSQALSKELYPDRNKQIEIANRIGEKTDEIEGYVSQIITASREDFLNFDVKVGEFYLAQLAEKITAQYGEKLALAKIDFSLGAYRNCLLKGDFDRSVEVIQNLFENAIKYGDGKQISLDFSSEEDCMLVSVSNGGCTLSDNELEHIFESFFRGSNVAGQKGSGLGLYIARQLMHKMDGEIFAAIEADKITVTAVFRKA